MKNILVVFICLITFTIQAQTFGDYIQTGNKYYDEEKFLESAKEYQKAFELKEGNASQYYNAACSWALSGNSIKSINCLNLSADKGWKNLNHIKNDKDLKSLHSVKGWDEILKKVQNNLEEYEKDFDKPLKKKLEKIYTRDQMLRKLYKDAEEKFGRDSEEMKYFWELISEQDSINEIEVTKIIDKKGWVGKSLVGGKANTTLWLVIQHAPLETQEKYIPFLQKSVKKGESKGSHLALLVDRIEMRNGKPQIYGSQIKTNENGENYVYEIKEPEYVNQRRHEVGLGSIEEYVSHWDINWKIEQKEK